MGARVAPTEFGAWMTRIVMKFGGTSLADIDRVRRAARFAALEAERGAGVAVVVSAMGAETDRLVGLAESAMPGAADRGADEYDVVVSSGEQVSVGVLALALRQAGHKARSWLGWQIPVRTASEHARARIAGVDAQALAATIDSGEIAIVPGFQGVADSGRIATLGRGGSDTSAVALAAALGAERCDIYTDVDGVYTTDPRIERRARRLDQISYEEMLELASLGAKVLQTRSVELAMARRVPLRVLSSLKEPGEPNPGTIVCDEDAIVEQTVVSGIAYTRDEARVTVLGLPDVPGRAAGVFRHVAEAGVNVDMIIQSPARAPAAANLAFTVNQGDLDRAVRVIEGAKDQLGYESVVSQTELAKVSVVGIGMRSHTGVAHTMFTALAERGISIDAISTSEIKISVLIHSDYVELAVRSLHAAYGLDAD